MRETAIFPLPIWGRFQLIFFHRKSKKSAILLPPVYVAYWRCVEPPTFIISTKFEVDRPTTIHRRVTAIVGADTLRDLVTLTFDLLTLDRGQTWLVTWSTPPPSLNILRLSVRDLIMSYDVRHRPPLTVRLEPLRMRRITWPVCRG